ncbi:hypothetical protein AJ79_05757, partial [Helicocarpus griseus UAMH5409]
TILKKQRDAAAAEQKIQHEQARGEAAKHHEKNRAA